MKEDTPPIFGLSKTNMGPGTIAAPVGNTLMTEDQGVRVQDAKSYQGDLSQEAKLIPESLERPAYTDAALDAALEGVFVLEVFVDRQGTVKSAELKKRVGYGMDERIIQAATNAKFKPRRDAYGNAVDGWTEIKFRLVIP